MRQSWRRNTQRSYKFESLEKRCLLASDVFISEFLASNDTFLDEDGDDPDWIEIFNAGPDDVNLDDWYLSDDESEPDKWSFPDQTLGAGNFLVIFASDKDRSVANEQLHTNFKISAGGEDLLLSQQVDNRIEVISSFTPFPEQTEDVSYGPTQETTIDVLLEADDPAKVLIPSSNPANNWNTVGFDDSSWQDATAGIGYQTVVPGFTVEDAKSTGTIRNIAQSLSLLNGNGVQSRTVEITPVVNFVDTGPSGRFSSDLRFPNDTGGDDNDFAIRATGTITIPTSGTWTFGTNGDDGARLRIDGVTVINDDTQHAPADRFGRRTLTAGEHDIELIFFERGGGAEIELFAAPGSFTSFNSNFRLIGDVEDGGLVVETSPTGGELGLGSLFSTDVSPMLNQASSAYLRVPFNIDDPGALDSLTLRMHYDDAFVAYINGTEVARRNIDGATEYDSTADSDRSVSQSAFVEDIRIDQHIELLNAGGENILAIHGINASADADEFLLRAELAEIDVTTGDLKYFRDPTPGTFNPTTGVDTFLLTDVSFDKEHGFYEDSFEVAITAEQGTSIRYTTNGTEPTTTNGTLYNGPITIDGTTTLRARSFLADAEPSYVATATYLFLEDVIQQSPTGAAPSGWPTSRNINGQVLDYGMDPAIVNSGTWGPQLEAALKHIPTMSIVMDVNDLLSSSSGIYVNAGSHGREWERPMSLEMINPDGSEGFTIPGGIRIRGGFSRSGGNPKHAFRLFFRDDYGASELEYPLFGDEGASSFKKIDLRTTQNYSWAFQGDSRNNFIRDIFSRDVQGMMGNQYTRGDYLHLYINGQYWGVFQTEERPEANFAASYYGGDSDDYDVVKSAGSSGGYENEATDGTLEAYQRLSEYFYQAGGLNDTNMEDYWEAQGMNPDGTRNPEFERLLDVDNLIDYMIITYFTSDADGPGSKFTRPRVNNYFGTFNREEPDGFKFFEHDSEHSLDTGNAAGAGGNMVTPITTGGSQFRYFNPHWLHERLAAGNSVYRQRFSDRVYETLFNGGPLSVEVATSIIDKRAAEVDIAMIAESARWGDAKTGTPHTYNTWSSSVNTTRNWIESRHNTVLNQLRGQDWYPDLDAPVFTVNGTVQHGGEVSNLDDIGLADSSSVNFTSLIPKRSIWRYLDDGSDQGTAWREIDFDDSEWERGRGELGYGDGNEATTLSFGNNSNNKHRTTYFRRTIGVTNASTFDEGLIRLIRDDGAVVYINGVEALRVNMPGGTINYQTEANVTVGGGSESTYFEYNLDLSLLQEGVNEVAVEIHQTSGTSSDISFDMELLVGSTEPVDGNGVFYTTDGSDPRMFDGSLNPQALPFRSNFSLNETSTVKTRVFRGGEWSPLNQALFTVSSVTIPGDLDGDGDIDSFDVNSLVTNWTGALAPGVGNKTYEQGDIDGDGDVDTQDRTIQTQNWTGAEAARRAPIIFGFENDAKDMEENDSAEAVDSVFEDVLDEVIPSKGFFLA